MIRLPLKRALLAPTALRAITTTARAAHSASAVVPRVARPAFWKSIVPKFLRPGEKGRKRRSKEWNPATFFIVIFLFIGSMSVQMISLRKDFEAFTRRADVKIGLLREVVEKLQRGEEVDVEKELGAGDEEREQAWENGLFPALCPQGQVLTCRSSQGA